MKWITKAITGRLDAHLECGILMHSFTLPRCKDRAHETLIAISRKRRGICRSCRMAETAAYLVDSVIPRVPMCQWVLSHCAAQFVCRASHTVGTVVQFIHPAIDTFLIGPVGVIRSDVDTGTITLVQHFGSAFRFRI